MTPRSQALAFRIWAYCEPRGWDCTLTEVADALDESINRVRGVCQWRGWTERMRSQHTFNYDFPSWLAVEVDTQRHAHDMI